MTMENEMPNQDHAAALVLQQSGADIVAILLEAIAAAPQREGREADQFDLMEGVGLLLSAAWQLAKIADDDSDGRRAARYAEFIRRHADGIEGG